MTDTSRLTLLLLGAALAVATPTRGETVRRVTEATLALTLPDSRLADYGLAVVDVRSPSAPDRSRPGRYVFAVAARDLRVESHGGMLSAPGGGALSIPVRGGIALRAEDPRGLRALRPVFLYDFTVDLDPDRGREFVRLVSADPDLPVPLDVRDGGVLVDDEHDVLAVVRADVLVSAAWADRLDRPHLAGEWIGELELRFETSRLAGAAPAPERDSGRAGGDVLDVLLGELYGITRTGRVGEYPNGTVGLAAATTSCNNGTVVVPWNAPMAETHPFIGLAVYREMDGALEMLGQNWIKHGFAALQNDQCDLGCTGGSPFNELGVGCSDTYGVGANASPYYLGPRSEVNPHTGAWEACGSFFDAVPVDCERDFVGDVPDAVTHRIEVLDADLGLPGATYYYECAYFVAGDDSLHNNIGWRECTMTWEEDRFWNFETVGAQLAPAPGPVVAAWADDVDSTFVAPDDGIAFLGVKVTPAGPDWHYEYALYNRTCARGIRSFAVPIGGANLANVGFRDIDQDPANDWTWTVGNGLITWSTDDWAVDPDAPALRYQTLFAFRFDADAAPVPASARMELFEPGAGDTFFLTGPAPSGGFTAAPELGVAALSLSVRPNPFTRSGRVSFSAKHPGPARLTVLDVSGRAVRVLVDGDVPVGRHEVTWSGRDAGGSRLAAGVYFFRLEQDGEALTRRGVLLR